MNNILKRLSFFASLEQRRTEKISTTIFLSIQIQWLMYENDKNENVSFKKKMKSLLRGEHQSR